MILIIIMCGKMLIISRRPGQYHSKVLVAFGAPAPSSFQMAKISGNVVGELLRHAAALLLLATTAAGDGYLREDGRLSRPLEPWQYPQSGENQDR